MGFFAIVAGSGGSPGTPTIGTATAGNAQATVAFTPPSYTGKGGAVTYRAISTPGSVEGTASSSPITVTGLTNGVAYTFQVRLETSYGANSPYSAASNSVTPAVPPVTPPVVPVTPPVVPVTPPVVPVTPPVVPVTPPVVPACTECHAVATSSELVPCGCVEVAPGQLRQRYFVRTYYTTSYCLPNPCTGCSCDFTVDGACYTSSTDLCFE